ncbi:MAG TPA: adenine phosphoribosyltransferase [Spirochaetia bacterium]|nr:adenine phosphoribosyltransferase [Spirochaetaceae bacterium]HPE90360.1 adenine phosphoribosyltransferase [Spirochaetales bacterium]HRW25349.1 adenine phosphoribosyltransferase [Spirochaetia bacterium]
MSAGFNLDDAIRKVPDFPKPGILFYDITSVLSKPDAFRYCVDAMVKLYKGAELDAVAAIESRGFLFAAPLADRLGIPLILVRKKGKLPGKTIAKSYCLEYGTAEIEIHEADIPKGGRVLLIDDLIATGGTLRAAADILEAGGAVPAGVFGVIGLPFLHYEKALEGLEIRTLIEYFGE